MKAWLRLSLAVLAGVGTVIAIAVVCFGTMRVLWPAYLAAEPTKAYTLPMMVARLSIGALCTVGAAAVGTLVARDRGRAAWVLGVLFLLLSLRPHLVTVWDDYPAWYHVVYLGYLVPLAGLTGRLLRRDRATDPAPQAQRAVA